MLALLPETEREKILSDFSDAEIEALLWDWLFWARPKQIRSEEYIKGLKEYWLILAGRGFGKTRTGAETVRQWVEEGYKRIALVAPTPADARDVMIQGESGLLNIYPEHKRPLYEPSKRKITFENGAIATVFSGANPEQLRGPQHDKAWCDELCAWQYPQETWDMLMFGLRLGDSPQAIITTTPKPIKTLKEIIIDPMTVITRGSTYENQGNLSKSFINKIVKKYEGTRLGRQELNAEVLDDNPNALWKRTTMIEPFRVYQNKVPALVRVVVGVDPAVTSNDDSNETGIIIGGLGINGHGYVLDDRSIKESPLGWASTAVKAYDQFEADRVVGEVNNGGDLVESNIRTVDPNISYQSVRASRGKVTRAEPISALYEQGKIHHVGCFPELEDQMCEWMPGQPSPDRIDALVWVFTELMLGNEVDPYGDCDPDILAALVKAKLT